MIRSLKRLIVAAAFGLATSEAQALFQVNFAGLSSTATTTTFNYNLAFTVADVGGTDQLVAGNFATLYDISASPTFLASSTAPSSIAVTTPLLGATPAVIAPNVTDFANLYNITFTYTGPTVTVDTNFGVSITLNGQYTTQFGSYSSQYQNTGSNGVIGSSALYQPTTVPRANPSAVPEPASLTLSGIAAGFGLIVARARRRR